MALGYAGKIVAASMLGLDFTVVENEQRVTVMGRDLDLGGNDFVLIFMWLYVNDWKKLSDIVDERELGLKGALGAVGAITAAFRLTVAAMAVEPYSRWRTDMDFKRRHGGSFQDTLLTKPKPYSVTYPDVGNPVAREAAKGLDFPRNYGNTENFKRG